MEYQLTPCILHHRKNDDIVDSLGLREGGIYNYISGLIIRWEKMESKCRKMLKYQTVISRQA